MLYICCHSIYSKCTTETFFTSNWNTPVTFLNRCTCFFGCSLMLPSQTPSQFIGKSFIAFFADRFQVAFVEFGFLVHFLIAHWTGEMMNAPGFIQSSENWKRIKVKNNFVITTALLTIASDYLIAHMTEISKELVVMRFAISKTFLFIMAMTKEWFFTLGTSKMLKQIEDWNCWLITYLLWNGDNDLEILSKWKFHIFVSHFFMTQVSHPSCFHFKHKILNGSRKFNSDNCNWRETMFFWSKWIKYAQKSGLY